MGLGSSKVALVLLVVGANQLFELLLSLLEVRRVRRFRGSLGSPRCISKPEVNPADFSRRKTGFVDLGVKLVSESIRSLREGSFGIKLQMRIVGRLSDSIQRKISKQRNRHNYFHNSRSFC